MTPLPLAVTLLLVSSAASSQPASVQQIVSQLSAACRAGADSSAAVEEILSAQERLEEALAELQERLTPAAEECPDGWSRHGSSCFLIPPVKASWYRAQHQCSALHPRARLATIPPSASESVQALVTNATGSSWGAWIGLVRLEASGGFGWSDGSRLVFAEWNQGEPSGDGDCVHIWGPGHGTARGWNDLPCQQATYVLCQITLKSRNEFA